MSSCNVDDPGGSPPLQPTEPDLQRVLASIPDYIWSAERDEDGHWVRLYYSPAVKRITGRPVEYFLAGADRWLSILHPEDRDRVRQTFGSVKEGEVGHAVEEYRIVLPDRSVRWVRDSVMLRRRGHGKALIVDGVVSEITGRREAEQRYRKLFERNLAGEFRTTPEGVFLDCNDSLARMMGLEDRQHLLQRRSSEFYPNPTERTALLERLERNCSVTNVELKYRRADGTVCWVLANISRVEGDREHPVVFEGTFIDITQRKRAEAEILRRNQQLAALNQIGQALSRLTDPAEILRMIHQAVGRVLDNQNFHIALYDEARGVIDFPIYYILGRPVERPSRTLQDGLTEYVLRTRAPLLIPSDMDATAAALGIRSFGRPGRCYLSVPMLVGEKVLGTVTVQDYEREGVYGVNELELLSTFAAQAAIALENARLYSAMQAELAERKQAEEALRSSEAKYRALVENLDQCVWLKDLDSRYVAANSRLCEALGVDENGLVGKSDFDFYPLELAEKYQADDRCVLREGKRMELEEQVLLKGDLRYVRTCKTPVRDQAGRLIGVLGIFWDVTQQRTLEAQLRQVQKMDAIGHLAGGIAHDFNNLLTGILGNLALTLSGLPAHDPHRELIAGAEKAALRAADLVRKLLGFSRRTPLRTEPLQLGGVIADTLQILKPALPPDIRVEVHSAIEPWTIEADPTQIGQVLLNLCLNARDAMDGRGSITLTLENVVLADQDVRERVSARPGDFVRLRVADTGHGIPNDIRNRIFEPFFTTKELGKGTGLGLAMVLGIVEQHRGWIECQSTVDEGTVFDVYLPRHTTPVPARAEVVVSHASGRGRETILLVEDEPLVRNLARVILERHGYRVLQAKDGLEALELYQASAQEIDMVLLDLNMPRLSGQETLQRLLLLDEGVRIVFSSGYSADLPAVAGTQNVLGFVGKPYRPEDLALAVRKALDQKTPRRNAFRNGRTRPIATA